MPKSKYELSDITANQIEKGFNVMTVNGDQPERVHALREAFKSLAWQVAQNCPPSRETSLALTQLEQAYHWAHSSIAHEE